MFLLYKDFFKKYVTPVSRLQNPRVTLSENLMLPRDAVIHFIADSEQIAGIDNTDTLMRNAGTTVLIHHVDILQMVEGRCTHRPISIDILKRAYHKSHLYMREAKNIDRILTVTHNPVVMNYSLLPMLNKYSNNALVVYQEWYNLRYTMWRTINKIGATRQHFIKYKLPTVLPTRQHLLTYGKHFTASATTLFHTDEEFNILELWRMINIDMDSFDMELSEDVLPNINLVFVESGHVIILPLHELLTWSKMDNIQACNAFYRFLDHLVSLRTAVALTNEEKYSDTDEDEDDPDTIMQPSVSKIAQLVQEQGAIGALSGAEQKSLLRMAERYKTIPSPWDLTTTLDKVEVTDIDLKVDDTLLLHNKPITIHDPSLLTSRLKDFDARYVKNVYHKDLIQAVLKIQDAGIIIKDVTVKPKTTAVSKTETISVSLQPIAGAASTIAFTVPVIETDGTFLSGGVKYRLDKQHGELPIVKVKPDTVTITSYYCKLFVTRNANNVSNYSKFITRVISERGNNAEDNSVNHLVYGISTVKDVKLPRAYTAVADTIRQFYTPQYKFFWSYSQLLDYFSAEEIEQHKTLNLVPCGRTYDDITLGMDIDGTIYKVENKTASPLGSLPYLIDPKIGEGPLEYTEVAIFNKKIPLILILSYIYGLDNILEKLGITFVINPSSSRGVKAKGLYNLRFKDVNYQLTVDTPEQKLLVGGFGAISKELVNFKANSLNNPQVYRSLLMGLGVTQYHLREIRLLWDMFIDPITLALLKSLNEPTELYELFIKSNALLVNDFIPDVVNAREKGYERIVGMTYRQLVNAVRTYRQNRLASAQVTLNPFQVWLDIIQDQTITIVEESNPLQNLKEKESLTHGGSGGRSTVTMVKNTRGFAPSDLGVISEASPDSSKVGVRVFMSANPNIINLRGLRRAFNPETDGPSSVLSTTALLSPAVCHDDGKRV